MKTNRLFFAAAQAALVLSLTACAGPRTVAGESYSYDGASVAARGPAATSDEDLRELRSGRERTTSTSSSSTLVNRSGKVKSKSSDTEVVDTVTETIVEMTPVAAGNEDF
jgi:hypothetical protein